MIFFSQIPRKWRDLTRTIYIRVTSVTIQSELAPHHCIHPYQIETLEADVIKDPRTNSLYFPVNEIELLQGEKR